MCCEVVEPLCVCVLCCVRMRAGNCMWMFMFYYEMFCDMLS